MSRIFLKYKSKLHSLELEVDGDLALFRMQVYSLTDVAPEDQRFAGQSVLNKSDDSTPIKQLLPALSMHGLNSNPIVLHKKIGLPKINSCTRIWGGDRAVVQAGYDITVKNGQGDQAAVTARICAFCAENCRSSKRDRMQLYINEYVPFACACTDSHMGTGSTNSTTNIQQKRDSECMFAPRVESKQEVLRPEAFQVFAKCLQGTLEKRCQTFRKDGHAQFTRRVFSYVTGMRAYENRGWILEAQRIMPMDEIRQKAKAYQADSAKAYTAYLSQQSSDSNQNDHSKEHNDNSKENKEEKPPDKPFETLREAELKMLLAWFKKYFSWCNAPKCRTCNGRTKGIGMARPTQEEMRFGAGRVEVYACNDPKCRTNDAITRSADGDGRTITRFPRYNHAVKVLQERRGRCGEWAQGFYLCVRAFGWDARMVYDFTDHVWVEVWIPSGNNKTLKEIGRWVHADSCENCMDAPLMYEVGWGKKLTYCIAVNAEQAADVTRRYTKDFYRTTIARRTMTSERSLQAFFAQANQMLLARTHPSRHGVVLTQLQVDAAHLEAQNPLPDEYVQLQNDGTEGEGEKSEGKSGGSDSSDGKQSTSVKEEETFGRQSGSEAWRRARNEYGKNPKPAQSSGQVQPTPLPQTSGGEGKKDVDISKSTGDDAKSDKAAAGKRAMAEKLLRKWAALYKTQLTSGCGRAGESSHCASCLHFTPNDTTSSDDRTEYEQASTLRQGGDGGGKRKIAVFISKLLRKHKGAACCLEKFT